MKRLTLTQKEINSLIDAVNSRLIDGKGDAFILKHIKKRLRNIQKKPKVIDRKTDKNI